MIGMTLQDSLPATMIEEAVSSGKFCSLSQGFRYRGPGCRQDFVSFDCWAFSRLLGLLQFAISIFTAFMSVSHNDRHEAW